MSEAVDELPAARDVPPAQVDPLEKFYVVENKTARSLQIAPIEAAGDVAPLIIPPFGARRISETQYGCFDFRRWQDPGLIECVKEPDKKERTGISRTDKAFTIIAAVLVGVGILGVFLPGVLDQILGAPPGIQNPIGILTGILRSGFPLFLLFIIAAPLVLTAAYLAKRRDWFRQGGGALALGLVAVSVIGVAAIGPVLIMMSFRPETVPVTGRMMQMIFVVIAALLPALLYFLYDRQKVSIVSKTFYREIVRFDPAIHTSADAEQKYGHLINEVYGDKSAGYYLANVGLPITLSSVLIALGWLLILLPINPQSLADFFNLVAPQPSALSFGFLGAYFFALNMVFRRYVRSDLTPKAYSHITVRLLVTTILVWAVSVLPAAQSSQSPVLLIMAFCIGIVPETAIKVIKEFMRKTVGRFSDSLDERDPLTNLEGIDLYDRARLSEEGVDNVENLAYHNLIDLLVQTRIPARRLADMVDQAILYLHLRGSAPPAQSAEHSDDQAPPALNYLRRYGIRTATDLIHAWRTTPGRGPADFEVVLRKQSEEFADRIQIVVGTLKEADGMLQLLYRRALVTQLPKGPVTDPDGFFAKETDIAVNLMKAITEDGNRQAAPERAGASIDQIVASAPVIEASATVPVMVEAIKPHL